MDKRRKPLTPHEQLRIRQTMIASLAEHPEWDVPRALKEIRTALHLTIADMAKIGGISVPALKNIEARRQSPTIATVESLLRPLGLKVGVGVIPGVEP